MNPTKGIFNYVIKQQKCLRIRDVKLEDSERFDQKLDS